MNPLPILEKIASDSGIEIGWLPLDEYTPPCASVTYNKIVMNTNWHNPNELAFQLAHEIAHIQNHDDCEMAFYHAPIPPSKAPPATALIKGCPFLSVKSLIGTNLTISS